VSQVADATTTPVPASARRTRLAAIARHPRAPYVVLAVLTIIAFGLLMYEGRQTLFYFDEWDMVLGRRGTSIGTFLDPHVGHLILVPTLIYKALFAIVGLEPYWPYRAVAIVVHLVAVWLLFLIARRRIGGWGALVVATLLLFLGAGNEVLLWPFQISYSIPIAAGLGAWLLLQERSTARDVGASVLLLIALCSSGVGVAVTLGVLVALLVPAGARSRVWVAAAPLALYLIWLIGYGSSHNVGDQGSLQLSNLPDAPVYMVTSAASAMGGIAGLNLDFGRVILGLALVLVVWRIVAAGISAWLAGALIGGLAFWGLTALGRADLGISTASSSRYVYVGAVFILLAAIYLPLALRLPGRAWLLVGLAVIFAIVGGLVPLRDYGRDLRHISDGVAPALAAVQVGGNAIPADDRPELGLAPQVFAGPYRDAVAEFGSPLPNGVKGVLDNPSAAQVVDNKVAVGEHIGLLPVPRNTRPASGAPSIVKAINGQVQPQANCLRFIPEKTPAALDVSVPTGARLNIKDPSKTPVQVRLRRFAPDFAGDALGVINGGQSGSVSFPKDTSSDPWVVRLSPAQPVVACLVTDQR
jgi:hypothetical protein